MVKIKDFSKTGTYLPADYGCALFRLTILLMLRLRVPVIGSPTFFRKHSFESILWKTAFREQPSYTYEYVLYCTLCTVQCK